MTDRPTDQAALAQRIRDTEIDGAPEQMRAAFAHLFAPVPDFTMESPDGTQTTLADYAGKPVVLNFWATWCAPCKEEMPALQQVQRDGTAQVVTLATGRNSVEGIERFFAEEDITDLPILLDPSQTAKRRMAVLGLPMTILIDAEGREVARLIGGADWADENTKAARPSCEMAHRWMLSPGCASAQIARAASSVPTRPRRSQRTP